MAQDKRGRPPEPPVDEVLNEVAQEETGDDFVAGPTQRETHSYQMPIDMMFMPE